MTRNISSWVRELMGTPARIDPWREAQVGERNDGPYKAGYQKLAVRDESTEPLVDVRTFGLVASDWYLDEYFDGADDLLPLVVERQLSSRVYLRKTHARRLSQADDALREQGLFLVVASGWRHPAVQEFIKARFAASNSQDMADRMFGSSQHGLAPSPHTTGAAVDLFIYSHETGEPLPMTVSVGDEEIHGLYRLERLVAAMESCDDEIRDALANRRLLYHLLCTRGVVFDSEEELFVEHPGEFWHFGDGDPLSSYLRREKSARYGLVFPADSGQGV